MKQRPSGENFLRKQGGFSTLTTVKLGKRFWWKQRTLYQWAPGRPEQILRLSRRWTTFWFWIRLGFRVGVSSSIAVVREQSQTAPQKAVRQAACTVKQLHHRCSPVICVSQWRKRTDQCWVEQSFDKKTVIHLNLDNIFVIFDHVKMKYLPFTVAKMLRCFLNVTLNVGVH